MGRSWRTVRVFISSTFRDMHSERDWLVKVVFPELRERMAKRNLYLVDVDLRWGVTEEEAEHGKVLEVCLDEIERCRPFFIGILGERYGFVPSKVPEDIEFIHPWLTEYRDHSLTALEIIHGVLRNPELAQRAFFYFRDPKVVAQVPRGKRVDYRAESPEAAGKLTALKEKIRASGRPVMENYPCRWDDSQGRVAELEAFGEQVLEDLWVAICAAYPEEMPEADPLTVERQMHEAFAEERSRLHVGREGQARRLSEYVQGKDRCPAVISGESGCGKSAFLANWYRKYANHYPDDFVLAYFIGASPDSTNHFRLLRNMCLELKRKFALKQEIPEEDRKLPDTLAVLLVAASRKKRHIVVLIDGLDQLLPLEAVHGLGWLLDYMPEKARVVVSTLEGDCLDDLRRREAEEITLPPLTESEQQQIVHVVLSEWRRKLDEWQMSALFAHPGVKNPLYLRVVLEELRLFGKFEELPTRFKTLADDILGMFDQVLARLEEDHGQELVSEAFSLLGCSRYGLSESELLELLRKEGDEQFPRALWARLARSARMYLVQRGDLISFFHRQLAEAVAARYPDHKRIHAKLASYFEKAPIERKLEDYLYQLQYAEDWDNLARALSDLDFLDYAWDCNREYEWMSYWRLLGGRFEPGECYQTAMETKEKTEGETESVYWLSLIGLFLHDAGLYPSALGFQERALKITEKALGPNHLHIASPLHNLAALYQAQGKYEQALPLYQRALRIYEKSLIRNCPDVTACLHNLATLYEDQGKYKEALPLYQRALKVNEKALGPEHPELATSLNGLAGLYTQQGKYERAVPLCKRALKLYEKALGPDHPDVATGLNNLAGLYAHQGKYEQAVPLCKRALKVYEKALGPSHPELAAGLNGLAWLYYAQGRYEQALPLYQQALKIHRKALGPDHPDVAKDLATMAWLYYAQGRCEQALPLYQRALKINEKALGPEHPEVSTCLIGPAEVSRVQGNYDQALCLYQRALKIDKKALGSEHPEVATCLIGLAELSRVQGGYEQALPLYQHAIKIDEKALGPNHYRVARDLGDLALLYHNQGEYEQALPLYQRALKIAEEALGANHPNTKTIHDNLKNCEETMRERQTT